MSRWTTRVIPLLTLAFLLAANSSWADPSLDQEHVPDQVIIKFKANASQRDKDLILEDLGAEHLKNFGRINSALKRVGTCTVEEALARYRNHPKVEFIEPNYILHAIEVPDDPRYDELWGMNNTGQTGGTAGADISAETAWDVFTGNPAIVVGVIDTGIDYNHPDLAANMWTNPGEIPGNGIDDDANGYVDDVHGYDFVNDDGDPMDDNGHGTHCAGTIGAVGGNGVGVAGVNWNVRLMGLKFLSAGGSGSTADAVEAIGYATMMALRYPGSIRLTSNSWGGGGFSEAMRQAIEDAGAAEMLFVAAAGNSSSNNDVSPHYPSNYAEPNVISVAATDHNDNLASFSSFGATTVDLAAPGVNILSTLPGNAYGQLSGTSMATPHVAGVAALTFGRFPAISALDARSLIFNGADPLPNLAGIVATGARLNAFWPIAEPDSIPPDPATDLAVVQAGSNWLDLQWTATGDDGSTGDASRYDLRYSTSPITEANWFNATLATGEPDPGSPGTLESMRLDGLAFSSTYYVGVKVLDEFGNASALSNVPNGTTLGVPIASVSPGSLSEALLTGGTATQQLTLSNVGQGTLDFTVPVPVLLGDGSITAHEYLPLGKGELDPRPGDPQLAASGGPDNFGYRWADSNDPFGPAYDWVDISGTGTAALTSGDDTTVGPFPIGFAFPFYGADHFNFYVCSNGFLSLSDDSSDYSNQPLPSAGAPGHLIAPFWDDLVVGSGAVYYQADGSRLIVQWDAVAHYGSGGPYTFQAILYPDGLIVYQYESIGSPDNSATVGWQNGSGSDGLHVVYNDNYVEDGLAVQVRAIPQWMTVTPAAGTVYAPNSTVLDVDFDASGLFGGSYDGIIQIASNDPSQPVLELPVQLDVTGAPDISVDPLVHDFGPLFLGATAELDVSIANVGTDDLTVSGLALAGADFSADLSGFTLAPRESRVVTVSFSPSSIQPYSTNLVVSSDDPTSPTVSVALSGEGVAAPQFAINPSSLQSDLLTGETELQSLSLSNSGGSNFEYQMSIDFHSEVSVYDGPKLGKEDVDSRSGDPVALGQGGPDNFGYRWIDSDEPGGPTFDWVDISGTGTPVFSSTGDDRNFGPFPVGFDFPFYGTDFSEFRVCSNGWVSFTNTSTDLSNDPLPATSAPENLLALFWDDLVVDTGIGGNVYYQYDGTRLVIQYENVRRYGSGGPYTMQALLYPSGTIVYQYLSMAGTRLDEATIGIQNGDRDDGLTVAFNADYVHDNLAVRLEAFPEWLSLSSTGGTIAPGGSESVDATFNASGLFGGRYEADIVIDSNDPAVPQLLVPVSLDVTGAPQLVLSATAIDFGAQFVGFPTVQNLIISNAGTDNLLVSGASIDDPAFGTNISVPVNLGPTQSLLVDMSFLAASATAYSGALTINSNDPGQPVATVSLAGEGLQPPVAGVNPSSLSSDLFTGESEVQAVQLTNSGGSDLEFSVGALLSTAQVVVHDSPDLGKDDVDSRPGILGEGGPDAFGYSWIDSDEPGGPTFDWVEISGTGTPVFSSSGDDRNFGPFPVGFDFPFYGTDFSEFRVCSNGWISFTSSSTDLSNDPLPANFAPENLLALFWDDLVVDTSIGGNVYYEYDGTRLVIQYENVRRFGSGGPYTMQALLYPNGTIVYQYLSMAGTRLDEATIGIQNATRDDGLTVVYNADYVHDNLAVRLGTTPDWLSASPAAGTVPPGGSASIQVTFDATGLFGGTYDGSLRIDTNDPARAVIQVPAQLDVTGIPLIAVDPASLGFGDEYIGASSTLELLVSNPGSQTLSVSGISSDDAQFTATPGVFDVAPTESQVVTVEFAPTAAGSQSGNLSIAHNADGSPTGVPVSGNGVVPPEIDLSPTEIVGAAPPGGSKTKTLQICNNGGSDLEFSLGASELSGASVTVYHEGGELPKEAPETAPGILGTGGPDAFGYSWIDSDEPGGPTYQWVEISNIGTPLFSGYSDDGNRGPAPIGFDFPFYGQDFDEFRVCSNGWLSFTSTRTTYTNRALPNDSSSTPENLLAVFWDDMVVDPSDGGEVYYYNDGSRLIVQWEIRRIAQFSGPYYSVQALLYPDGRIVYQYEQLGSNTTSATIGIQNAAKDDGLTVVYNDSYVAENLAIEFSSGTAWLSASPESGVVAPGECVDITVVMDAASLEAGDHAGSINITSNDLDEGFVELPVTFHVGTVDATDVDADPNTLNVASNGKFLTVRVELPPEYDPADVLVETVSLNGAVMAASSPFSASEDFNGNGVPDLAFKFDRGDVANVLPEGTEVEIVVTGEVEDTTWFVATDLIRVINPTMVGPNGGEECVAGEPHALVWDNPVEWNISHSDLFWSPDAGENWYEIARNVEGESYGWTAPLEPTDQALVRVFSYDNQGLLGFDTSDEPFTVSAVVTGTVPDLAPTVHALRQSVPNPFNPRTTIRFELPRPEVVHLAIYDSRGRLVKVLASGHRPMGVHEVVWDGIDERGRQASSGLYHYRLSAGEFTDTRSMVLTK